MAYNKTTWENAPSTNTPINATNLNKIEQGIYDNSLGVDNIGNLANLETTAKTTVVAAINEVNSSISEVFSTSETETNMVWVDNKPIYRMVIQTTSPSTKNTWSVVGSITNIGTIINLYGFLTARNNRIMPINYGEPSYEICTTILNDDIEMMVFNNAWQSSPCYIVAEYTKSS